MNEDGIGGGPSTILASEVDPTATRGGAHNNHQSFLATKFDSVTTKLVNSTNNTTSNKRNASKVSPYLNGTSGSNSEQHVGVEAKVPGESAVPAAAKPQSSSGHSLLVLCVVFAVSLVLIFWVYSTFPNLEA
jgi:hypothetical protein